MLVLSRKNQESVVIGSPDSVECLIKITVIGISGARVKLGFEVDKEVPVHRWEVWEQIHSNGNGRNKSHDPRQDRTRSTLE